MDQTLLDMKYAELVRHAKDLGITFASSKVKRRYQANKTRVSI